MPIKKIITLVLATSLMTACSTVPITGRQQLSIIPASSMLSMSYTQYDDFLKGNKVSADETKRTMVLRVGQRIQRAVEEYFAGMGMESELKDYRWDFNLVESPEVNAWCMPGGKVVVYTGLLPIAQTDTGLAVVMGHEIAHAIAEHGSERMSQGLIAQLGGVGLAAALQSKPEQTRNLWMSAFGMGSQVGVLLPFSRIQEKEADELGLVFMAMAGYDPHEAVGFWERMAKASGGKKPPELLSTHPSDETRISKIKELLPGTMKYYRKPAQ